MSIGSLMIWLLMHLRVKEATCGLARTMMEMCRVIFLLKVETLVSRWANFTDSLVDRSLLKKNLDFCFKGAEKRNSIDSN